MKTKYDFVLGLCTTGSVSDLTTMGIAELYQNSPYWFRLSFHGWDSIGAARSQLTTTFLDTNDSNVLIFLDTDVAFNPDDITKLLKAIEQGYNIIAGGYIRKSGNSFAVKCWEKALIPDGKIHEVECVPAGFLAITRKALEQIRDRLELPLLNPNLPSYRCYPFFESGRNLSHMSFMGEDCNFCDKARKAGLKVYWHTGVIVGHLKRVILEYDNTRRQDG